MKRRLGTVLAADIMGYSGLMEADETGTMRRQKSCRHKIIEPARERFHGRIFKEMGDGFLAEFQSVADAVGFSATVQRGLARRNGTLAEEYRIIYRMGINLGDVVVEDDDLFGDTVNVAARLEQLARPGGICVSGSVHDHLQGRADHMFRAMGEQILKGIARPVRVYRVVRSPDEDADEDAAAPPDGAAGTQGPEKPSIAVLPFDNMSGVAEQEYFADGLTEEVTATLSRTRWLFVIARNSAYAYKGRTQDVRIIGRNLNVQYVLEGSVRKAGNDIRVTAQLIETLHGSHVWADTYDRTLDDIFGIQDDIATRISGCIQPEIERAQWKQATDREPSTFSAWDQYLRGLPHMHAYTREGNETARTHFQKALAIDPDFSPAHSGLATVYFHDIVDGYARSRDATITKALAHARTAVAADDQDALAHCVKGRLRTLQGRFDEAIRELQTAVTLNPSLALGHHGLGYALYHGGDAARAIGCFKTAEALSPHDHNVWAFLGIRAFAYIALRDYPSALEAAWKAVDKPHAKFWANVALVSSLGHLGRLDEARRQLAVLQQRQPGISARFIKRALGFTRDPAQIEHLVDGLRAAGLADTPA